MLVEVSGLHGGCGIWRTKGKRGNPRTHGDQGERRVVYIKHS